MIDNEDKSDFRTMRRWLLGTVVAVGAIGLVTVAAGRLMDLAWFPWQVKMQTSMIRNSNSYITTQQSALRNFRMAYDDASTSGQKLGVVRQMREIADTIADDVQPDIATFLQSH